MQFTDEHRQLRDTVARFVAEEINPHVKAWEAAEQFPSHEVFGKMGDLGLLGVKYPEEDGGLGLDFSYAMVVAEELGRIDCGGVPMAIGVQTDMCTPALARFGSAALREEFLRPAIRGRRLAASAFPNPAPARTWRRRGPTPGSTATITSSTARRCGSPTG